MDWILVPIGALIGYLFGSVPTGLWVTRLYGVDIRTVGSGRTGGTNAWRAAGLKAAIPTILGDAVKGAVAVILLRALAGSLFPNAPALVLDLAVGLTGGAAIWGHNWPLFAGFNGGAGGITAAATAMAVFPLAGGIVWITGALLIWWSRIASVGTFSVGAVSLATLILFAANGIAPWPYVIFGAMAFIGIFLALRRNRQQLKDQKERIITIW
ncbi:MAG: glycerol-3-phosphate acyltransferase [Caldilineaceae bacterium]|nr:glycerol-3-phosphate acyltransferase [Caldilineaceae bacterium]